MASESKRCTAQSCNAPRDWEDLTSWRCQPGKVLAPSGRKLLALQPLLRDGGCSAKLLASEMRRKKNARR